MSPRTVNMIPARCRMSYCRRNRATAPQRRWACDGLCGTCYRRWVNQGFPEGGPRRPGMTPRVPRGQSATRLARFAEMVRDGATAGQMCDELGVTRRTLARYGRRLEAARGDAS